MYGILTGLMVLEALVTAAVVIMLVWRGLVDMKEEDQLILFSSESQFEQEQVQVRLRAAVVDRYLRIAGIAWGALLVVLVGLWVVAKLYYV
jgi:hypothetical protein